MKVMNFATMTDMKEDCQCLREDISLTFKCLLVTGLDHCDPKWLPLGTAKMQQVCEKGM